MKRLLMSLAVTAFLGLGLAGAAQAGSPHIHRDVHFRGNYFNHGVYFNHGYKFWSSYCWNPTYRCYTYWCPQISCNYYWCVPDRCYYPITYCPYGRFRW